MRLTFRTECAADAWSARRQVPREMVTLARETDGGDRWVCGPGG